MTTFERLSVIVVEAAVEFQIKTGKKKMFADRFRSVSLLEYHKE